MIHIEADKARNLLRISFSQQVGLQEAREHAEKVKTSLADLQPGFRLLTDLSELQSMDLSSARYIEEAMDLCDAKGVSKIVRAVPDPRKDIGLNIMSLFHYRRGVQIVTCGTLAEAERALAD